MARIHSSTGTLQPMTPSERDAHRDCLLSHRPRASNTTLHDTNVRSHSHTIVKTSHSFDTITSIYIQEEEEVSDCRSRPDSHQYAPWFATENQVVRHTHFPVKYPPVLLEGRDTTLHPKPQQGRYLTQFPDVTFDEMSTTFAVPGSPPDLTDSRSSKSSSYGSLPSHLDETSIQSTNFEEIGLDDDNDGSRQVKPSNKSGDQLTEPGQSAPYFTARRTTLPNLRRSNSKSSVVEPKSAPADLTKHKLKSPSLTSTLSAERRQRSSSPPQRLPRSASSISLGHLSFAGLSPQPSFAPSKRSSWQPRKSAAEIEAEYHDSDDELPEDASLWNVPISPFPAESRSALSSARGSPERIPIPSPQPLPLEYIRSHPDSPPGPRRAMTTQALTRQRLTTRTSNSNLSQSRSISPQMPVPLSRSGRAKSWNVAMADLSPEARIVSQNLECHVEKSGPLDNRDKWLPPIPHRSSAPSMIQLPPVQRGPLDFMPISKEKEAILSRTRPSWLPPKDPREERKHLKQYQIMMAASLKSEKERESKSKETTLMADDTQFRLGRIWQYYVEPTTDIVNIDRRVHALCWRGITPRLRGKVWQRSIGNPLGLTTKAYHLARARAEEIKSKEPQDLSKSERTMLNSFADIERDAETAFPGMRIFQRKGPLWQELIDVCEAHACYRSDIGYAYGVQLMAALLLLQISEPSEAFLLLENCLNSPVPLAFLTRDVATMQRTYHRVISTLSVKFPRLHDYLFGAPEHGGLGMTGEEVLETMFRTLFSNGLDIDRLCRVWDIWVFEGDRTLVKSAVAILGSLSSQIFDFEGDLQLKRRNVQEMLGWGPFQRSASDGHWQFDTLNGEQDLVEGIRLAGKLDYTGH